MPLFRRREFLTLIPTLGALFRPTPEPDPFHDPEWLARWKQAARQPIWQPSDTVTARLLRAIRDQAPLDIRYHAGSTSCALRKITPSLIFTAEGFRGIWLSAWCHTRQAERVFRLDLIELCRTNG